MAKRRKKTPSPLDDILEEPGLMQVRDSHDVEAGGDICERCGDPRHAHEDNGSCKSCKCSGFRGWGPVL